MTDVHYKQAEEQKALEPDDMVILVPAAVVFSGIEEDPLTSEAYRLFRSFSDVARNTSYAPVSLRTRSDGFVEISYKRMESMAASTQLLKFSSCAGDEELVKHCT